MVVELKRIYRCPDCDIIILDFFFVNNYQVGKCPHCNTLKATKNLKLEFLEE